jgi:hypothetical protein
VRPSTPPGDDRSVYCVCTVTGGAQYINEKESGVSSRAQSLAVRRQAIAVGTGFAISSVYLLCARHCIFEVDEETSKCRDVCAVKVPRPASPIRESDTIRLTIVADNVFEDWIVLKRVEGTFGFWSTVCPETDLPRPGDEIGIRDYPVGLTQSIQSPTLSLAAVKARVHQYGNRTNQCGMAVEEPKGGVQQDLVMDIVSDTDYKEPAQAVQDVITVDGGRVRGSCGAPYFNTRGEVVAFHVFSINDAGDDMSSSSGHSHMSHSQGYVLSRLPHFCEWRDRDSHSNLKST